MLISQVFKDQDQVGEFLRLMLSITQNLALLLHLEKRLHLRELLEVNKPSLANTKTQI